MSSILRQELEFGQSNSVGYLILQRAILLTFEAEKYHQAKVIGSDLSPIQPGLYHRLTTISRNS